MSGVVSGERDDRFGEMDLAEDFGYGAGRVAR